MVSRAIRKYLCWGWKIHVKPLALSTWTKSAPGLAIFQTFLGFWKPGVSLKERDNYNAYMGLYSLPSSSLIIWREDQAKTKIRCKHPANCSWEQYNQDMLVKKGDELAVTWSALQNSTRLWSLKKLEYSRYNNISRSATSNFTDW